MPVVWAVTLGWDHRACRVKLNRQVPASWISAHRLLQQKVHADAPRTSSLPKLQIQTSQTDSSSWKSPYIPTLTLCRQEQFQSCLLSESLTSSEPHSAPGAASFCWFVLGQPEGARWNRSDASAVQVWSWCGRKCSQGKHRAGAWADSAVLMESGFLLPYSGHRSRARIPGQTTKPWKLDIQEEKRLKLPKAALTLLEKKLFLITAIWSHFKMASHWIQYSATRGCWSLPYAWVCVRRGVYEEETARIPQGSNSTEIISYLQ